MVTQKPHNPGFKRQRMKLNNSLSARLKFIFANNIHYVFVKQRGIIFIYIQTHT